MSQTRSTRASLTFVAILLAVLAVFLGPTLTKAALPVDQGDVYIFAPTGVTVDQEVRLTFHNFTKHPVTVQFLLLDADGRDLFVANKINATMTVAPGKIAEGVVPCNGVIGPVDNRAEVTGVVIVTPTDLPGQAKLHGFVGPASLQLVDELTKRTLLTVSAVVTPLDLAGIVGPTYLRRTSVPIE